MSSTRVRKPFRYVAFLIVASAVALSSGPLSAQSTPPLQHGRPVAKLPARKLAPFYPPPEAREPAPTENLADAIALAYRANPTLQASRYDLRAIDEDLGIARSELRPTTEVQIIGQYDQTVAGRTT